MSGVPKDEATRVSGLDMMALPDGDVTYMPIGMIAVAFGDTLDPRTQDDVSRDAAIGSGESEVEDDDEEGAANAEDDDRDKLLVIACGKCGSGKMLPMMVGEAAVPDHYRCMACGSLTRFRPKAPRPAASNTIVRRA